MKIFVSDVRVAQALSRGAEWQECVLAERGCDGVGCVTKRGDGVSGVAADVADRASIDAYFSLFSGDWAEVTAGEDAVLAYVSSNDAADFTQNARRVEEQVARDVAVITRTPTEANQPINRTGLVMRARSFVRARDGAAPVELRAGFGASDVEIQRRELPYSKYFDAEDIALRHKRFDGSMSDPMLRSVFRSADAVTVLPYDPLLDLVVLVEQFRPGAFVRGDAHPWVLEPVAGRCDGDEPVELVAEREMIEEAGLTLLSLESIGNYYPSPGCLSEYLYSFVGLVDLSDAQTGVHGLETENEDIRTHFLSFDAAMALAQSGEAENGPLLLSLYWLAANRARLRGL
ncbi:NUDIX domain-containing protein [Amylibacter sp.]|nr:NUDIX domain-containing protein [Amylibacter sp.]